MMNDIEFMKIALEEANIAMKSGEVPVGAIIIKNGEIIARGHNTKETEGNALGHAEINAIIGACEKVGSWRLHGCTMYVTLEPCPMCAGAVLNSRIDRIVYGAKDSKSGACGSVIDLNNYPFNHKIKINNGICERECSKILTEFFKNK